MFLEIATQITLPIVAISAFGFALQRRLAFDVASLNRLSLYAILPCFLVHHLSSATVPLTEVGLTAWFTVAQFFVLLAIGWGASTALKLSKKIRPVVSLAAAFPNSGNFAIPLVDLAFGREYILHQAVIVSLHSVLITSVGVILLASGADGWRGSLRSALRTPLIPAVAVGLLLKGMEVQLPQMLAVPLQIMGSAYTPVALFALGAQLAATRFDAPRGDLALALGMRLLAAPLLTWLAVLALGVPRGLADMLVVTASVPVGVLLAIVCDEYRVGVNLAPATVFLSTVLSPIVVTAFLYAVRSW